MRPLQDSAVFDRESVVQMVDGDTELMQELIELFLMELPNHLESLRTSCRPGCVNKVILIATRIRASAHTLGGRAVETALRDVLIQATKGSLKDVDPLIGVVAVELSRFAHLLLKDVPAANREELIRTLSTILTLGPGNDAAVGHVEANGRVCEACHRSMPDLEQTQDAATVGNVGSRQERFFHVAGIVPMSDTATQAPVFDRESVLDMVDGEIDFMQELIEMFLEDLPGHLDTIRQGIGGNDATVVQQTAHRLKSSVGNLGGRAAQESVIELEHEARSGSVAGANELFQRCEFELDRFQQELEKEMVDV